MNKQNLFLLLIFFISLQVTLVASETTLHLLSNSERARCVDGSFPGFYFEHGTDEGANKFYIYIEGGFYCYGQTQEDILQHCYERSQTDLGSSNNWPLKFDGEANLSNKEEENPLFYNWNKIFIKYCDGTYFQSSAEPIHYKDTTLYLRGNDNMREILDELSTKYGLLTAETVVLAGGSAGGQTSFSWTQYVRNLLPENVKMVSSPDCGLNVEVNSYMQNKNPVFVDLITNNNRSIIQPKGCPYLYDDENLYKCFFQEYLLELVPVPVFFISSLYDQFFLPVYLNVKCIDDRMFINCTQTDEDNIHLLRDKLINLLNVIKSKKPEWGAWAISCIRHVFSQQNECYDNQDYEVPPSSSITAALALKAFVEAYEQGRDTSEFFFVDHESYPNNAACSVNETYEKE